MEQQQQKRLFETAGIDDILEKNVEIRGIREDQKHLTMLQRQWKYSDDGDMARYTQKRSFFWTVLFI